VALTRGQKGSIRDSKRIAAWDDQSWCARSLCIGSLLALVACGEQERPPPLTHAHKDASVHSQGGSGGLDAGRDSSEEEASIAGEAAPENLNAGGAADSESDRAEAGESDVGVQSWTCNGNYAYWATSLDRFESPTPEPLAQALTAISKRVPAVSLVLHQQNDVLFGALSATVTGPSSKDVFPPSRVPSFAPAVLAFGSPPGVTTTDAQPLAFLRFVDEQGPVEIQIEHLVWRATEGRDCKDVSVRLQAVLPTSQFSIVLHLAGGDRTLGELVDSSDAGDVMPSDDSGLPPTPVEIALAFQGVPMAFEFSAGCCSQ
jgi:hypothetical protein